MTARELVLEIAKDLSEKKGEDIVIMNVEKKTTLCTYMIIAGASSTTQVKALAENVEEKVERNLSLSPTRTDGKAEGKWSVIDYGDVIVHIFEEECREFYHLERLWQGENVTTERYEDAEEDSSPSVRAAEEK